jgi:hypothetical protein
MNGYINIGLKRISTVVLNKNIDISLETDIDHTMISAIRTKFPNGKVRSYSRFPYYDNRFQTRMDDFDFTDISLLIPLFSHLSNWTGSFFLKSRLMILGTILAFLSQSSESSTNQLDINFHLTPSRDIHKGIKLYTPPLLQILYNHSICSVCVSINKL